MASRAALCRDNINVLWGSLLIEELIRNGVDYFCLSPGSRSAPLAVAAARHPHARATIIHDERAAAFHAVGYARASGNPAALICTSGTAAANYYPACIEAALDQVPLIVLSADRPPESQDTGANQTIRQNRLFGDYARWYGELPCPSDTLSPAMVLTTLDQAVYRARNSPAGPAHLNCPFREPLAPEPVAIRADYLHPLNAWLEHGEPFTRYLTTRRAPDAATLDELVARLTETRRGLVSVGRLDTPAERDAVVALLETLQWPVVADITSGLRLWDGAAVPLVTHFDRLLLAESFRRRCQPDTWLHLGGPLLSKRIGELIGQTATSCPFITVKNHPFRHDPAHRVSCHVEADIGAFCAVLGERLERRSRGAWARELLAESARVDGIIGDFVKPADAPNEIGLARLLVEHLPSAQGLWLGSSMPIRAVDFYAGARPEWTAVGANRGTSGIEGTLAAATGFAAGGRWPVTVLLGDLALLHDLNSLLLARNSPYPLVIVVINNNGGGIFSFLPIARFPDVFETYFATPHGLGFAPCAEMFSLDYARPASHAEFVTAYRRAAASDRSTLIEVVTDRQANHALQQTLQRLIATRLDAGE